MRMPISGLMWRILLTVAVAVGTSAPPAAASSVSSHKHDLGLNASLPVADQLRGKELNVRVHVSSKGNNVLMDEDGSLSGICGELLSEIAKEAGFGMRYVNQSDANKALHSSSFTACLADTADPASEVDLCIGAYGDTEERRQIGPDAIPAPVYESHFLLYVRLKQADWSQRFLQVFVPFKPDLWAALCAMIFLVGTALFIVEMVSNLSHNEFSSNSAGQAIIRAQYLAFQGFFAGAPEHTATTLPGQIILLGFGFLILVSVAAYTANLAAFLSANLGATELSSIQEAELRGSRICSVESFKDMFKARYPRANLVAMPKYGDMYDSILNGTCDGILVSNLDRPYNEGRLCDVVPVGGVLLSLNIGFPVRPDAGGVIGYYISKIRASGMIDDLRDKYRLASNCPGQGAVSAKDGRIELIQMATPLLITLGCVVISLVYTLAANWRSVRKVISLRDAAKGGSIDGGDEPENDTIFPPGRRQKRANQRRLLQENGGSGSDLCCNCQDISSIHEDLADIKQQLQRLTVSMHQLAAGGVTCQLSALNTHGTVGSSDTVLKITDM